MDSNPLNQSPEDFSSHDLSGRDMTGRDLIEANFRGSVLNGTNFTDCNLYRADFRGARFHNAVLSMNCATFHGIKLDKEQVNQFLYLLCLGNFDRAVKDKIYDIIGRDLLPAYDRMFGSKRTK